MIKQSSQPFVRSRKLAIRYFFICGTSEGTASTKQLVCIIFIKYIRGDWNVFFNLPLAAFTALVNLCIIC